MNKPLTLPHKLPKDPLRITMEYKSEPTIQKSPIRFKDFTICKREHLLDKYDNFTKTWLLASFHSNEIDQNEEVTWKARIYVKD